MVRGVPLRVMEMTGDPGDVIIWHPWLFHCATSNCTSRPRLMLRQPINRREVGQKT
jgi:ectoine hydroxylase-related dioxygenase (phytanoyl-CoA dioxygenase family)